MELVEVIDKSWAKVEMLIAEHKQKSASFFIIN
jgi:hypothetical protein